jgi:hypothetical protein
VAKFFITLDDSTTPSQLLLNICLIYAYDP